MKNTHHAEMTELLIGRNLAWIDAPERVREAPPRKTKTKRKPSTKTAPSKVASSKSVRYEAKRKRSK